jgi:hypothetical protein
VAGDWELWVGEESRLYDTREEAEQVNRVLEAVGWGGHVTDNRRTLGPPVPYELLDEQQKLMWDLNRVMMKTYAPVLAETIMGGLWGVKLMDHVKST